MHFQRGSAMWRTAKLFGATFSVAALFCAPLAVHADENDAKRILKSMSDYVNEQTAISFEFDAIWEVVTDDGQKLALASSGTMTRQSPDMVHFTRRGGFADLELSFDGKTLTLFGKNLNAYAQKEIPGTVDHLINELRAKYHWSFPAADVLASDSYDALMQNVVDVKDLGSGVVNGMECDYFAFRAEEVDWQIWIAQGERPYPCRFVITSKLIEGGPQYSIQVRDWKSGDEVAPADFSFKNVTGAEKIEIEKLSVGGDLPDHFSKKEGK